MIQQKEFSLTGAADKIIYGDITFDDKNTNAPLVIFVHGFKGFKNWGAHNLVARYFAQNGFRYLKLNLSHSGVNAAYPYDVTDMDSFAKNTISKEMLDTDLVINYALQNLDVNEVYLIGHSRGGGIGILQAANNPNIKALITWSAIADFSSLWNKQSKEEWRKTGKIEVINTRTQEKMPLNISLLEDFEANKQTFDILDAAKRINIPWLIVHGDDDVIVPFETAQKLSNSNKDSRLIKIEGANHVFGASHPYQSENLPPKLLQACEKSLFFLNQLA